MNSLSNGVSISVTIPAGAILKSRGTGTVALGIGAPGACPRVSSGPGNAMGPFSNAVTASLSGTAGFRWAVYNGNAPVLAVGPYQLDPEDDQAVIECSATLTITAATGLTAQVPDFSCVVIPNGTTSVASDGVALINGATTTITRTAASNAMFAIQARVSANDSFVANGS